MVWVRFGFMFLDPQARLEVRSIKPSKNYPKEKEKKYKLFYYPRKKTLSELVILHRRIWSGPTPPKKVGLGLAGGMMGLPCGQGRPRWPSHFVNIFSFPYSLCSRIKWSFDNAQVSIIKSLMPIHKWNKRMGYAAKPSSTIANLLIIH